MGYICAGIKLEQADRIRRNVKRLVLSKFLAEDIIKASPKVRDAIDAILEAECARREENRISNMVKAAGFPSVKKLEDYDFSELKLPESITKEEITDLSFLEARCNLILYGICGSGKTMLAIALAMKACLEGKKAKFITLAQLAMKLKDDKRDGKLQYTLDCYKRLDLLVIDEWGYCQLDKETAGYVYQVISDSYEKKSLILTTNLPFSEWGKIFTDEQLAAAIIDRVVHYGHMINTGNKDWRLVNSPMNRKNNR